MNIVLFVIACVIGKMVLNIYETWWVFNVPAVETVAIGEFLWMKVLRKKLVEKNERKNS